MISHRVTLFVDHNTKAVPTGRIDDILNDMCRYAEQEWNVEVSVGTITPTVTPTGPDGRPL